jgi:lipopolysaccharide transport system permease protein
MLRHLRLLIRHRDLLFTWTLREIQVRYKQSVVGVLWALLQPLALMSVFTVVFSVLARVPTDGVPYPVFSYAALLPWTFFSASITFGVPSLVNNMNLVTKIYFPREILPIASVAAALFDLCVAAPLFAAMIALYDVRVSWVILWTPLLLLVQVLLTLGVVLLLSAVNVFYRDVRFVLPLLVQVWMYASPIIYPVSLVPASYRLLYMLNPMAGLLDSYRRVLVLRQPPVWGYLGLSAAGALLAFTVGYAFFKRSEAAFADVI